MLKELYKDKWEIKDLPVSIREFLDNQENLNKLNKICASFELNAEQEKKLQDIILRLAQGKIDLYKIASFIADELEINFSAAMDINDKLYEELFISKEIDLNANYAAHQEAVSAEIPKVTEKDIRKSEEEKSEFSLFADKAVKKFNLFSGDAAGQKKFSEIADTFLSNVRTKSQFKNTLTKPVADGGLQMAPRLADDVAEFLASYSRLEPVIARSEAKRSDAAISSKTGSPRPVGARDDTKKEGLAMTQKIKLVPPNVKIEVSFEKEEKEANKIIPKIEKIKTESPKLLSVTEGAQKALAELNYTFPSSELQERLKSVIDARVRNVRTSVQTFDKLTQDIPSGGMGLEKLEADRVSLVLNRYLEEKNKDIYSSKIAEIKKAEAEEKKKQEEKTRASEETEKKRLDERFTKLTGKASTPLPVIASEARQSQEVRDRRTPSGLAMTPKERPVLEDIKFTLKLAGPVEEIARLTLEDFRKLSGDPKESVLKIKDKLTLLREESYKKYQDGIDAWRRSPLYGEYLKVMGESLVAGVSLGDALKGGQTLTQDEFDAIINSRIGD